MARETKSGLLSKRKTNADKMKEAREAKAKDMEANTEPAETILLSSEPITVTKTSSGSEMITGPASALEKIGRAAGSVVQERPNGYRTQYVETKTKRVQLVFQPSLHERVKKAAKKYNLSVNEYVHQILDSATQGEG